VAIAVQPLVLVTRPGLDVVMSPRGLGDAIRSHVRDGATPVTFRLRDYRHGTLSYYAGQVIRDIEDGGQLRALVEGPGLVVVVTLEHNYRRGPSFVRAMTPVHRQRLDRDRWVVLVPAPAAR
jgi:hypothetical protein